MKIVFKSGEIVEVIKIWFDPLFRYIKYIEKGERKQTVEFIFEVKSIKSK